MNMSSAGSESLPPTRSAMDGEATSALTAHKALLKGLSQTLTEESKKSAFTIGGFVPIVDPDDAISSSPATTNEVVSNVGSVQSIAGAITSNQVILRWDSHINDKLSTHRIDFPVAQDQQHQLEKLVNDCEPATFGRGNKDVFDETYRRARKLDETDFSTDFSPYSLGIIDSISKILLPSISGNKVARTVRAELYKLNVYSGPSGKFKPHVDTPRSNSQFGSLVVCLPCAHEGGQLVVRHAGESAVFDWSAEESSSGIGWSAFYSDCEHEVLQVTKGHRITLTYNLYVVSTDIPRGLSALDPKKLPLYTMLNDLLIQPGFMKNGGFLGLYCAHAYAHTTDVMTNCFPWNLKGVDMTAYQAIAAAGLQMELRPVIRSVKDDRRYWEPDTAREIERNFDLGWNRQLWGRFSDWVDEDQRKMVPSEATRDDIELRDDIIAWYKDLVADEGSTILGRTFNPMSSTEMGGNEEAIDSFAVLREGFGEMDLLRIVWLNERQHDQPAMVHLTYGNQAGIQTVYSSAALIFRVLSFRERTMKW